MAETHPLDALKKDPRAAQLLSDPTGLRALLSSPETQQLMALLDRAGGDGLQAAAQAAAAGKPEELMALLGRVMQSPQGAAAVDGIQKKANPK